MTNCSIWLDGQVPCPESSHPDLQGLCPVHFLEHYVRPAADAAFAANQEHLNLLIQLNRAEVALGLRSAPYSASEFAANSNRAKIVKPVVSNGDNLDDLE
jgi:hypothetical protein